MPEGTNSKSIRIGGACGFWGEADVALPQFLASGKIDYVIFDYLAEITMSIMAASRQRDATKGFATDFISAVVAPNLAQIAAQGVKLLANAGGVNPRQCAAEIRKLIDAVGLDLTVAVVLGDDLLDRCEEFSGAREMFSGTPFPQRDRIASINAYLGAFPIARALDAGADIVVTGRCADSALALAPCIHEFGWAADDWDRLAAGSLAGHLLECGPQACGGNFTDWERIGGVWDELGYPIAEIAGSGAFVMTKPAGTRGEVSIGTVAEQMLYEIGDPQAYELPDVVCDFSEVGLEQVGPDRVAVGGAKGRPATASYKTSLTYSDGWKLHVLYLYVGENALTRSKEFSAAVLRRTRAKLERAGLPDFAEISVEPFGGGAHFGAFARPVPGREIATTIAARHADPKALTILLKELTGLGLSAPSGFLLYPGGRPKPAQVIRLFSFLVDKAEIDIELEIDGVQVAFDNPRIEAAPRKLVRSLPPQRPEPSGGVVDVPLRRLAWGRAGDKGDKANIGLIPRRREFAPWIWSGVTEDFVARRFEHFLQGPVERFFLPGTGAMNLLLHDALGGGGMASLRNDTQGKSYAQILLDAEISIPAALLSED